MSFIFKTAKTLRNNWKKSTFAAVAITYGYNYTKNYLQIQDLMRVYCEKAAEYGKQALPINRIPRTITVILNPKANKRKANDDFEKYCAPILHLAGLCVNIIPTESEGHAKTLMENINGTDAIVIAGGDGTISEVITGLLRRTKENKDGLVPVGILPLGRINTIGTNLFQSQDNKLKKVQSLADASLAIVEEDTKLLDVMKIEIIDDNNNNNENKPIYALSEIKWGAYRDTEIKKDDYWYYGRLRKYAAYLFNGFKNSLTWDCDADIKYTPPCRGCKNCIPVININRRWYNIFHKKTFNNKPDIINEKCSLINEQNISTIDFSVKSRNILPKNEQTIPNLQVNIGPETIDYLEFVKQGWQWENTGKRDVKEIISARTVELRPIENLDSKEEYFSIDNENYEVKPIRITLLPEFVKVFCKRI